MSVNTYETLNAKVGRRSFLKMSAIATAFGFTSSFASTNATRSATEEEIKNPFPGSKIVKSICTACSVGCGVLAEVQNGVWVRQEVAIADIFKNDLLPTFAFKVSYVFTDILYS